MRTSVSFFIYKILLSIYGHLCSDLQFISLPAEVGEFLLYIMLNGCWRIRRNPEGEGISESAKAEVPPQTPPSWPRGFSVGTGVLCAALWVGGNWRKRGKRELKKS